MVSAMRFGHRVAFWMLFPFTIPQGLWLRARAPRFGAAAGPHTGEVGSGKPLSLLAIGDSVIAGVGARTVEEALPGQVATALADRLKRQLHWFALGSIGADARKIRQRLVPKLPSTPFDLIVLSAGVNDVTGLRRTNGWRKELGQLLDDLRGHSPDALIVLADLPDLSRFPLLPQPLAWVFGLRARTFAAAGEIETARRPNCAYARLRFDYSPEQFSPDGFHPSAESYRQWGQALAEFMTPWCRASLPDFAYDMETPT
ncbi:MAG: SGNH/GDSL hydrolase family protein [Thermodesulfobacteriota bacterium]